MAGVQEHSKSLLVSLKALLNTILGLVQTRVELFAVELQEEKLRVSQLVVWVAAIILFGLMAFIFLSFLLVVVFWEHRIAVVLGLFLFYGIGAVGLALGLRAYLRSTPLPFSATVEEIKKDRAWLKS
jgi:uncharacterized membrane protein YqjE